MFALKPKRTFVSVVRELIDGLESGTICLHESKAAESTSPESLKHAETTRLSPSSHLVEEVRDGHNADRRDIMSAIKSAIVSSQPARVRRRSVVKAFGSFGFLTALEKTSIFYFEPGKLKVGSSLSGISEKTEQFRYYLEEEEKGTPITSSAVIETLRNSKNLLAKPVPLTFIYVLTNYLFLYRTRFLDRIRRELENNGWPKDIVTAEDYREWLHNRFGDDAILAEMLDDSFTYIEDVVLDTDFDAVESSKS